MWRRRIKYYYVVVARCFLSSVRQDGQGVHLRLSAQVHRQMAGLAVNQHRDQTATAPARTCRCYARGITAQTGREEASSRVRARGLQTHRSGETGGVVRASAAARRVPGRRLHHVGFQPVRRNSLQVRSTSQGRMQKTNSDGITEMRRRRCRYWDTEGDEGWGIGEDHTVTQECRELHQPSPRRSPAANAFSAPALLERHAATRHGRRDQADNLPRYTVPWITRWTVTAGLNPIRSNACNQWKLEEFSVMWSDSDRRRPATDLAAALRTTGHGKSKKMNCKEWHH